MVSLPFDLQELILRNTSSDILYKLNSNGKDSVIIDELTRRTKKYCNELNDAIKEDFLGYVINKNYLDRVPDEFKEHMEILYKVIHLPSQNTIAIKSISHLMSRYSMLENATQICKTAEKLIDGQFDALYYDEIWFNATKALKYSMRLEDELKEECKYTTFEETFYFLCNVILHFYKYGYDDAQIYYGKFNGFHKDLKIALYDTKSYITDSNVISMINYLLETLICEILPMYYSDYSDWDADNVDYDDINDYDNYDDDDDGYVIYNGNNANDTNTTNTTNEE